ncbi:MAG: hypothetical protein IJB11_02865, partial [Oscillospiraceae bacterium]|nr:hypothetical protein [Oscillospiraceae bacterium]
MIVKCTGNSNVSHIRIVTYLERYVNGDWERVNIGTTNNQWVHSVTSNNTSVNYFPRFTVRGQYRASTI